LEVIVEQQEAVEEEREAAIEEGAWTQSDEQEYQETVAVLEEAQAEVETVVAEAEVEQVTTELEVIEEERQEAIASGEWTVED